MKSLKLLGGIFIVAGTTIGAGMLALPATTAFGGFFPALALFALCWLLMLCTAFFFLDVNLAVKGEPNFITMAGKTLGSWGKGVSWIVYLLLLYSLLAAYITAGSPLFAAAIKAITGVGLPAYLTPFCLPIIFGFFVYLGTESVDYVNRLLMVGLIITFLLLAGVIPMHIEPKFLLHVDMPAITIAIPVIFTSFGYHSVIPTLSTYLKHDRKQLRLAIVIGSLLPLLFYLFWLALVLGVVPIATLGQVWQQGDVVTDALARAVQAPWLGFVAQFFTFFAVITSVLGVALGLCDFLIDGLKLKRTWDGRLIAIFLTFLPPLIFVFTYKRAFYLALDHAGALVAILLGMLPAAMAWKIKTPKFYSTPLGRVLLSAIILISFSVVIVDFFVSRGSFKDLIVNYFPSRSG